MHHWSATQRLRCGVWKHLHFSQQTFQLPAYKKSRAHAALPN